MIDCFKNNNIVEEDNEIDEQLKELEEDQQREKNKKNIECNCWVCKILNSVTNETTTTTEYEGYNIVSETGDSIFFRPYFV